MASSCLVDEWSDFRGVAGLVTPPSSLAAAEVGQTGSAGRIVEAITGELAPLGGVRNEWSRRSFASGAATSVASAPVGLKVGGSLSPGEVLPPRRVRNERRYRPAGGVSVHPVDPAGGRIGAALRIAPALGGGGDEEPVQAGAAQGTGRDSGAGMGYTWRSEPSGA